jgi:DNA polymerase III subunit epsilon
MGSWSDAWVSLDTETTGFGPEARIIEIGVTRFERGRPVLEWSSLLFAPGVAWEAKGVMQALEVNGIKKEELIGKPVFSQVYPQLLDVMAGRIWVAHNSEFDIKMLVQECDLIGKHGLLQVPEVAFCTKTLAYQLDPELPNHKLETVAQRWRVKQNGAHRALSDAKTCGQVLSEMYGDALLPDDDGHMMTLFRASQQSWKKRRKGHW